VTCDGWKAALAKVVAAVVLYCPLGCNEATLSLFPQKTDASPTPTAVPPQLEPEPEPLPGLFGHWPLDASARDFAGSSDGELLGNATFVDDPLRGKVLSCDGIDAGVSIPNLTPLDFSYAVWVWTDVPSQGSDPRVATPLLWSNVGGERIDDFLVALVSDRLMYLSYGQTATGTQNLADAAWHHLVVTRREAARVELYVDARADGDGNAGSGTVTANPFVYVCANPDAGSYLAGKVDDLRLYDRVLTADDVQRLYDATRR
jgi:Concanavalin A-like lectin/glucanases superfamily